jgi:hypothetical protein
MSLKTLYVVIFMTFEFVWKYVIMQLLGVGHESKILTLYCICDIYQVCRGQFEWFLGLQTILSDDVDTDRSRAEKLWLVCGVMGDAMPCDRERDIHRSQKCYATIHSEKMSHLTIVYSANANFQQLYVFAMNNKASPPSTNPTKKCRALFPYFPSFEGRLAGEHIVPGSGRTLRQENITVGVVH